MGSDAMATTSAYGNLSTSSKSGAGSPGGTAGPGGYKAPGGKGSINIGGGYIDPATQIWNDPGFQQLKNNLSASGIADAAHLRGLIQQALIQFGSVPNLPSDVQQAAGLDTAGTQALADQNPFSTLKQMAQKYQTAQDAEKNQLASRGILSSGETGYQLGQLGQQNAQGTYDATNSLLGNVGGYYDQYVQGQQAAANQLAQGAMTAEGNAAANNAGGAGTVSASWDPATGLYKDPNGNFYDPSGNPVSLPSGGGQTPSGALPGAPAAGGGVPVAPVAPPMYDPTKIQTPGTVNAFA